MKFQTGGKLSTRDLREAVKSNGIRVVAEGLVQGLVKGTIKPDQLSLKALWEGCVGPCDETLGRHNQIMSSRFIERDAKEQINSQAFSWIMGNVIVTQMIAGYEASASVLSELVETRSSSMKVEPVPGFQAFGAMNNVDEGKEYDDSVAAEKVVLNPEPKKRGRVVYITEEAVMFDQTSSILDKAKMIGIDLYEDRERNGLYKIQDLTGYKTYYPVVDGTPTQTDLYRTSAGTGGWYNRTVNAQQNALEDWTDLEAVFTLVAAMTNEAGNKIHVPVDTMLVPAAKYGTALRIVNGTEVRVVTNTANTTLSPNVITPILGGPIQKILWSPFMNDTTTWYAGSPKRQFRERVIMPPSLVQLMGNDRRDVVAGFKARWKGQVEATDDKFFTKNTN